MVDGEGAVDTRIVNQTFPTNRCARLFKIDAHDNEQVSCVTFGFSL